MGHTTRPGSGQRLLPGHIPPGNLEHADMARRFDNPRGYVGLHGIHCGKDRPDIQHAVAHGHEMGANLARVGVPRTTRHGVGSGGSTDPTPREPKHEQRPLRPEVD